MCKKKFKYLFFFIVFFMFISTVKVQAKGNKYDTLLFYFEGRAAIDSQINGSSYDYNIFDIMFSDVQIEVEENNEKNLYNIYKIYNAGDYFICEVKTKEFSEEASIIFRARVSGENIDKNAKIKNFQKAIEKDYMINNYKNFYINLNNISENKKNTNNFGIYLDSQELQRKISYDVIFKIDEENGNFNKIYNNEIENLNYLEITGIVPGDIFPELPQIINNEHLEFDYWYDELSEKTLKEIPLKVNADYSLIARMKKSKSDISLMSNIELIKEKAFTSPKNTVDNNIFRAILEYIIALRALIV